MTTRIDDDFLESTISQLGHGRSTEEIIGSFPDEAEELRPLLQAVGILQMTRSVNEPASESLLSDRNDFIAGLTELQLLPVSPSPFERLKGWISQKAALLSLASSDQPKEMRRMSILALKVTLICIVAFGSLGGTLAAAADSLPGTVIYPIKIALEEAQLALTKDPVEQAAMHLEFAQERIREMVRLANQDQVPEEKLLADARSHLLSAYQLSAHATDEKIQEFLAAALEAAQVSRVALEVAQENVHTRLRERLHEASGFVIRWQHEMEAGMQDPDNFQWRYGLGGPCEDLDCQPPNGDGDSEQERFRQGSGIPPCEDDECLPPYGDGDQDQNQHQNGSGGSPCDGDDCQPPYGDGDQEQNQEQHNEQNQAQGDTQDQNQEQNGDGPEDPQSGGSGDPGGADGSDSPGGPGGDSGNSNGSGGAGG